MKKYLYFIFYPIYYYYKSGGRRKFMAFDSALIALEMMLVFNFITVSNFFHIDLLGKLTSGNRGLAYIKLTLFVAVPLFFLLRLFIKEEEIKNLNYSDSTRKRASTYTIIYFIASVLLLFISS